MFDSDILTGGSSSVNPGDPDPGDLEDLEPADLEDLDPGDLDDRDLRTLSPLPVGVLRLARFFIVLLPGNFLFPAHVFT